MAENFTAFTEVDPNSRISKTATRVTWTDLTRNEDAYVYLDKGVAFFDDDFTHFITINITAGDTSSSLFSALWMIADAIDSYIGIFGGAGNNAVSLDFYYTGTSPRLVLNENVGTGNTQSAHYEITLNTPYYLKIIRDESVGTYGTLYCYIYSDSARTTLLDTLSLTLTVKNDFRYLYALASFNATNANKHSGYTENLSISDDSEGYIVIYPINQLLRASGIRRTFWAGLGGQSVYQCELALGGMSTSYVSPIGSRDIPSAVTPEPNLKATYDQWLNYYITNNLAGLIKTFGHIPTYEEWMNWIKQGQAPYFPKYF